MCRYLFYKLMDFFRDTPTKIANKINALESSLKVNYKISFQINVVTISS